LFLHSADGKLLLTCSSTWTAYRCGKKSKLWKTNFPSSQSSMCGTSKTPNREMERQGKGPAGLRAPLGEANMASTWHLLRVLALTPISYCRLPVISFEKSYMQSFGRTVTWIVSSFEYGSGSKGPSGPGPKNKVPQNPMVHRLIPQFQTHPNNYGIYILYNIYIYPTISHYISINYLAISHHQAWLICC